MRVNGRDSTIIGVTPRGFHGTILAPRFDLWVPATLAPVLIAGSRELEERDIARLLRDRAAAAGVTPRRRRRPKSTRRCASSRARYPRPTRAVSGEVLPFWQSPRGPQRFLLGASRCCRAYAAVAARGLRQHRQPGARARQRAAARDRHAARRRRRPWRIVRLLLIENLMLAAGGAAARRRAGVVGHRGAARRAACRRPADQDADAASTRCSLAFGARPGLLCG